MSVETISVETMQLAAAVILGMHGIGHILGLFPILGFALTEEHSAHSWLLTPILGNFLAKLFLFLLFLAATLAFVGSAMALFNWQIAFALWQLLAMGGAAISLMALLLFPRAFPTLIPNVMGAVIVDAAILMALLWLRWPSALLDLTMNAL